MTYFSRKRSEVKGEVRVCLNVNVNANVMLVTW